MSTLPGTNPPVQQSAQQPVQPPPNVSKSRPIRSVAFWMLIIALLIFWLIGWWAGICGHWIHGLAVLVLAASSFELWARSSAKNIESSASTMPNWDLDRPLESLAEIHSYVIKEAAKSIDWYWARKVWKSRSSQTIRFLFWLLAAIGGILPIIGKLFEKFFQRHQLNVIDGLWASLFLGVAAALLGLDKTFGFSSGWARYVLAASNIRKGLEEFRLEWADLMAKAGPALISAKAAGTKPSPETVTPLIERAKQFRSEVEGLVLQETKDWVTEFQSTMQQMEKDVAAQLSTLKAQVDKTVQEREAASKPGYVQLTIKDPANKFAKASLKATLFDSSNQAVTVAKDLPVTSLIWTSPFVPPGFYHVKVEGTVDGAPFDQTRDATVKSGEKTTPTAPDVELK
jgi:hypothetical protein